MAEFIEPSSTGEERNDRRRIVVRGRRSATSELDARRGRLCVEVPCDAKRTVFIGLLIVAPRPNEDRMFRMYLTKEQLQVNNTCRYFTVLHLRIRKAPFKYDLDRGDPSVKIPVHMKRTVLDLGVRAEYHQDKFIELVVEIRQ